MDLASIRSDADSMLVLCRMLTEREVGRPASERRKWARSFHTKLMRLSRLCTATAAVLAFVTPPKANVQPRDRTTTPVESDQAAPSSPAIPSFQISERAEGLDSVLQELNRELLPRADVSVLQSQAAAEQEKINRHAVETLGLLAANPNLVELEDELRYWQILSGASEARSTKLNALALRTKEYLRILLNERLAWQSTWNRIHGTTGIDPTIDRVRDALNEIKEAESRTQQQLNFIISLQNEASQQAEQMSEFVLEVRDMKAEQSNVLLRRDSAWLAKAQGARGSSSGSAFTVVRSLRRFFATSVEFVDAHPIGLLCLAGLYGLVLIGMQKLRHHALRIDGELGRSIVLQRPFSTTLLLTLMVTGGAAASAPILIGCMFCLLFLIPIIRLFGHAFERPVRTVIVAFGSLYILESFCLLAHFTPSIVRGFQAVISCLALAGIVWLIRKLRSSERVPLQQRVVLGSRVALLLLGASLIATVVGYANLAQLIATTVIVSGFVGLGFFCGAVVLRVLLEAGLRAEVTRNFLGANTKLPWRLLTRALAICVFLQWLRTTLQLFALYPAVIGAATSFLRSPIRIGSMQFTIGGALTVLCVLLVGYAASKLIYQLLNRAVLPRLPLQRGVPFAISQITYYVLLIAVGSLALSAAGVELNRFTVLTGALGVGLGFGLQNIVNNFVSGLILLVERPVHLGDTIDVGGLVGNVRRIGARSSTVVTSEGAEVIVPNSILISNQVVNWTLSSQWRRVDVPIAVAFGIEPETVIELLVNVAQAQPGVLLERPPVAFFLGFGGYALNFELRFWSAEQETWFQLKSDVSIAVSRALRAAGIEVPFPQQDIRIRDGNMRESQSLKVKSANRPEF